jgi:hypothetical protein
MSQLIAMLVRIDDENKPEELTELWRQPLPTASLAELKERVTWTGWKRRRPRWVGRSFSRYGSSNGD